MLFNYLQENLCVFTGRLECGFRVLSTNSIAYLHPHSVICQTDNIPQFLIFDHLLSLDKDYLVNVTAIPSDLVMKSLSNNTLKYDCEKLFDNTLISHKIHPVGEEVLYHLFLENDGAKLKQVIERIKIETGSDLISVEPSVKKGCVYIYALPNFIDSATASLQCILNVKLEELVNEYKFNTFELVKDQNSILLEVQWSKGALTTSVKIKSDPRTCSVNKDISRLHNVQLNRKLSNFPYALYISWIRRHCTGNAFVDFSMDSDFKAIINLSKRHIVLHHSELFMQINKDKPNQLHISGLPPEISKKILEKELKSLVPNCKIDRVELIHILPFETPYPNFKLLKNEIINICKNLIKLDCCEVVMEHPKPQDINIKICIKTNNCKGLSSVCELITKKLSDEKQFISEHRFGMQIKCNAHMCQAIAPKLITTLKLLESELKSQDNKNTFDSYIEKVNNEFHLICVNATNADVLQKTHDAVNNLLNGEIISENDIKDLRKLFCHGGYIWLKVLQAEENVYIIEDNKKGLLCLYGTPESCERAKHRLVQFLKDSENDIINIIQLYNKNTKNLLIKAILEKYGVDLKDFIEKCRLQSAFLDIRTSELHLCGNQKSMNMATNCIGNLLDSLDSIKTSDLLSQEICPVCISPAITPTYRLGYCGHLYCQSCIQALIEWDNFPIQCLAKDCCKELVLKDVRNILLNDPERIKKLLKKSIDSFLEKNTLNVIYCPAPGCPMFYFKNDLDGKRTTCMLCQNDICISCNAIYHTGFTCDLYQRTKNNTNAADENVKKLSGDRSETEQKVSPGKDSTPNAGEDEQKCTGGQGTCVTLKSVPDTHKYKRSIFQPTKPGAFLKTIQKEMKILKSSLPEGISVKSFEDRLDLYSILIKGPKGTPYEDGLFFFNVQFPANYPNQPPHFHYISYCQRINPNLYEAGKVCVSLLGTWSGQGSELWNPKTSNLLQVLISIQGLILVPEPYFNEPGYESLKGSEQGMRYSIAYNEMVVLNVVKAMSKLLVSPQKEFQDEIMEHFETCSSKMIERLEAWVAMSEAKHKTHSSSTTSQHSYGYHYNPNYYGYPSQQWKPAFPSPSTPANRLIKQLTSGFYPSLHRNATYSSPSTSSNASNKQCNSAEGFSDNIHMPEFPLIPASVQFCRSLKEALFNFKGLLSSLNIKLS